jgi:hypothetical protein
VYQDRGLEAVALSFVAKLRPGQPPELVVDQREETVEDLSAVGPREVGEDPGYGSAFPLCHWARLNRGLRVAGSIAEILSKPGVMRLACACRASGDRVCFAEEPRRVAPVGMF